MDWTPEKEQVFRFAANCAVAAGAGSGKTAALVELYDRLVGGLVPEIRSPEPEALGLGVERIVAITFTEKAAHEMRERIRQRIEERIAEGENLSWWDSQRRSLLGATIATFHSYCATLLREHPVEAAVDPDFTVLEEREADARLRAAAEEAIVGRIRAGDAACITLVERMGIEENGAGLLPAMVDLARAVWGAGHGAAELAGIVLRQAADTDAAWPGAVRDLAKDMERCLSEAEDPALYPAAKTGKAAENRVAWLQALREACESARGLAGRGMKALSTAKETSRTQGVLDAISGISLPKGKGVDAGFKEHIESARARSRNDSDSPDNSPALLLADREATPHLTTIVDLLVEIERTYGAAKKRDSGLDFDDLQRLARDLLRDHPAIRAAIKSGITVLLVDEFQDTNPPQRELVYLLAEDRARADLFPAGVRIEDKIGLAPRTLFVVGDPKQSIYLFRGADVGLFKDMLADLVRRKGERISFRENYRSVTGILSVVNALFQGLMTGGESPDAILYDRDSHLERGRGDSGREADVELLCLPTAQTEVCATDVGQTSVCPARNAEERRTADAAAVADRILGLLDPDSGFRVLEDDGKRRPARYGDVAILFRALSDIAVYERELRLRGIPYFLVKGRGFFASQEVWDLRNLLRFLETGDSISLLGVLRSPLVGLSDDACAALATAPGAPRDLVSTFWRGAAEGTLPAADAARCGEARGWLGALQRTKNRLTVAEILERALEATRMIAVCLSLPQGAQAAANVKKFVERARDFRRRGSGGLREFVLETDRLIREEAREAEAPVTAEAADVVRCMSIHQAKGLEFPIVFVPDLGRQAPPHRERLRYDPRTGLALRLPAEDGEGSTATVSSRRVFNDLARREAEEAKRLLYVAMTRAKDYLVLSGEAGERSGGTWRAAIEEWVGEERIEKARGLPAPRVPEGIAAPVSLVPGGWIVRRTVAATRSLEERLGEFPPSTPREQAEADRILSAALDPSPRPPAPTPVVVTSLGEFSRCARRTLYAHILGLEEFDSDRREEPPAEGRLTSAERGTIAHAVLERVPLECGAGAPHEGPRDAGGPGSTSESGRTASCRGSRPSVEVSDLADDRSIPVPTVSSPNTALPESTPRQPLFNPQSAIRNPKSEDRSIPVPTSDSLVSALVDSDERAREASPGERRRLVDDLVAFVTGPTWARIASSSPERELPFVCPLTGPDDPPLLLSGTMDACFEDKDGVWTVAEYKYAKQSAEAEEHYRLQLQAYALALHKALGAAPVRAWLCFLRDRGRPPIEIIVTASQFPGIEAELRRVGLRYLEAHASRDESHWPKVDEPACRRITCGYRGRCGR